MFNWDAQEDILALAREEAILAGEKARLYLELEDGADEAELEVTHRTIRQRLATTLVQLGIRLDPLAAEDLIEASEEA
ncbi:MAG TPA: hypothetical protein VFY10_13555 [Dehalococcoidia bacterium]|nr:hypothetical protein [Dehalococcoidia bacterium]